MTITGNALPLNPTVRIGDAAAATVVRSSTTELVFRAPARVAGSYGVHVFALDDREWTLADALTYVADGRRWRRRAGDGSDGVRRRLRWLRRWLGGRARLRRLGRRLGRLRRSSSDSGSGGSAGPVVTAGPNGERLVRTSKFAALGSIWSMNCSVSCTGVAI